MPEGNFAKSAFEKSLPENNIKPAELNNTNVSLPVNPI